MTIRTNQHQMFYIKRRETPQTTCAYYSAVGKLTRKEKRAILNPLYGENSLIGYKTLAEYNDGCKAYNIKSATT